VTLTTPKAIAEVKQQPTKVQWWPRGYSAVLWSSSSMQAGSYPSSGLYRGYCFLATLAGTGLLPLIVQHSLPALVAGSHREWRPVYCLGWIGVMWRVKAY